MIPLTNLVAACRLLVFAISMPVLLASMQAEDNAGDDHGATKSRGAGEPGWNVIAECQMVVLPQKAALPLIPDLSDDDKIEAACGKLMLMIEHGEATLLANLSLRGESGVKLVTESVEEVRYPSEYTPPQLPQENSKEKPALKNWPAVGPTPTAFETRNVGATLVLNAGVSADGQWVSMEAVAQHVRLLRFAKIDSGILLSGEHVGVEQPRFSSLRDTVSLHVPAGQRILLGVHKDPTQENNLELFLLRVRVQRAQETK